MFTYLKILFLITFTKRFKEIEESDLYEFWKEKEIYPKNVQYIQSFLVGDLFFNGRWFAIYKDKEEIHTIIVKHWRGLSIGYFITK